MPKKRPNNDGSINHYKTGWRGQYTDPITHKQRAVYGRTYDECRKKLQQKLEEIRHGVYVSPDKVTTGAWLDFWFENFYRTTVKASTAATTESNIRVHIKPALGAIPLQKLSAEHVQAFIRHEQAAGINATTIKRYIKMLRQAMLQAVELKKIPDDPTKGAKLPPVEKKEIPYLTDEEQAQLLPILPNTTGGRALRFLLGTGLRVGELCALKWKDLKRDGLHVERIIMSVKDLEEDGYTNIITPPKTSAGRRIIPMTGTLLAILEEQRLQQMEDRLKVGSAWEGKEPGRGDTYIFANMLGKPADRHNLNRCFRSCLDKAQLPRRGVHALRHTFATNWVHRNPDISALSRILGHTDPAFTYKTYCHADPTSMQQGMNTMEQFIKAN